MCILSKGLIHHLLGTILPDPSALPETISFQLTLKQEHITGCLQLLE